MQTALKLAGFFAAHAIWCVCEGETLVPILAVQKRDGTRELRRMENEKLEDGVVEGHSWLKDNPEGVPYAVFIYDGFITLASGKTDALLLEIRDFASQPGSLGMAVPYRHANNPEGFAVLKPKLLAADPPNHDFSRLADAFFQGVDQHEKGSSIWNAHLNEGV